MKYKLLAMLLTSLILVAPVLGFWHLPPPPDEIPPCTFFGVLINGEWAPSYGDAYIFEEPEDNFCDNFIVEVFIYNVTDLYGYEFELTWNEVYFNLVDYEVEPTWPSMFILLPDVTYDLSSPYKQVAVAMDPSVGVTGDFLLATLTFHIRNDVCWLQGTIQGKFNIKNEKASNSCSGEIELCDSVDGHWKFKPVQPNIFIDPPEINCSKVGTTFEVTVWLENIVKMNDFSVWIYWDGHHLIDQCNDGNWTALLYTKKENVVINEAVFPKAWADTYTITVSSPACGEYFANPQGFVSVVVDMNSTFPLINGTVWLFKVTFVQCDPWYCGKQPDYEVDEEEHTFELETAETDIYFVDGSISVYCPDYAYMYIGSDVTYANAHYEFLPIPGDLDGSGHTGIEDLMILALYYGMTVDCDHKPDGSSANAWSYFYDLNDDGVIDVYDLVIVAKNFCRSTP